MPSKELYWGQPNERQRLFLLADKKFVAYGGARGGGKSWALRHKAPLMCLKYDGFRALIIRRSYPELRDNHILPLLAMLGGAASYSETQKAFSFANSSRLMLGYCDHESDVTQYQGREFDAIFMDEATHFSFFQFTALTASLRGVNDYPKRFYLSCNPGGAGHAWVKRLFIDREYQTGENPDDYLFIPAKVYDNQALMTKDPGYINILKALPDDLRSAWLDGDWDALSGRFFPEFDRERHVTEPFVIPTDWTRYFCMDYGMDMLAGHWIAVDGMGRAYVYRELHQSGLIISEAAAKIKQMTTEPVELFIAPPDMWNRRQETGRSAAEIFAENGIFLYKAGNNRNHGWMDLKEWLKPAPDSSGAVSPAIKIFSNCSELIKSLANILRSERDPTDCADTPHELTHHADALRYFVSARPRPAPELPEDFEDDRVPEQRQIDDLLNFGR